jgi:hypothetical protein
MFIVVDRIFFTSFTLILLLYLLGVNSVIFNITSRDARALLEQPNTLTAKRLYDIADVVATGTIANSSATINDSKIWTYMKVQVEEYLKNPQISRNLTIKSMGGTVGNISSVVEDSPLFKEGDRVLLFLNKEPGEIAYRVSPFSDLLNNPSTSEMLNELKTNNVNTQK